MSDFYLAYEKARCRELRKPVYRFAADRYECPFCRVQARQEDKIYDHMKKEHPQ